MDSASEIRQQELDQFLKNYFPKEFLSITPMQGDAGFRSYFRINLKDNIIIGLSELRSKLSDVIVSNGLPASYNKPANNASYILMDCPPSYCSIKPFIDMANYLRSYELSAPEIIVFDIEKGFLILEDFGDISIKKLIQGSSDKDRTEIYTNIVEILIFIQENTHTANLKIYDNKMLLDELSLFIEWYIPYILKRPLTSIEYDDFIDIWQNILSSQIPFENTLILRDYHAENMMYLENRQGVNIYGLLDFQDAMFGSPVYDLVSALEDARIEVPKGLAEFCVKYFARKKKLPLVDVMVNYHILGAQRNSRILGVFARKLLRDKNYNYLQYIPLVLKYISYDLSHPIMKPLNNWFNKVIK